jgi:hypothetical protein
MLLKINEQSNLEILGNVTIESDLKKNSITFTRHETSARIIIRGQLPEKMSIKLKDSPSISVSTESNESNVRINNRLLTACLTILDSKIKNLNIEIIGGTCEDSLNVLNSQGSFNKIIVTQAHQDAVDFDFSHITINDLFVYKAGNDCLDFSDGTYTITTGRFYLCADKAVSVGEKARLSINKMRASQALVGVAAKDGAIVKINDLQIDEIEFCAVAFRKKQEYDGAFINIISHNCNEDAIFAQEGSKVKVK